MPPMITLSEPVSLSAFARLTCTCLEAVALGRQHGDEPEGISLRRLQKGMPVAWTEQTWC